MEKIKVVIQEGAKTAREINEMLVPSDYQEAFGVGMTGLLSYEEAFYEAESKLRTFEVQGMYMYDQAGKKIAIDPEYYLYTPIGSIHEAEVINDKQIRIL